jgi:hypothetical protein
MATIISRTEIINDELYPTDGFEMSEAFGIKSKKKTKDEDHEFPMQIPHITKMQDKDKSLMKELMKSGHKYELTKIERTAVLTLNGKIFIRTAIKTLSSDGIINTSVILVLKSPTQQSEALTWPVLTRNVQPFCNTCKLCQFHKKTRKQYGKIPVKMAEATPL